MRDVKRAYDLGANTYLAKPRCSLKNSCKWSRP